MYTLVRSFIFLCIATSIPLVSIADTTSTATTQADDILLKIAADYFDRRVKNDPMEGSATLGGEQFEGKVAITIGEAYKKANHLNLITTQKALKSVKKSELVKQVTTYDMLTREIQLGLEAEHFPSELMPTDRQGAFPADIANMGNGLGIQPLKTPQDYDNYLKRLSKVVEWNQQAITNLRLGLKKGITISKPLVEKGLPPLKALTIPNLNENPYYQSIALLPKSFSVSEQERITKAYQTLITTQLIPSTQALVSFIENEYLPKARTTSGLLQLPNGKAWYDYQVKYHTSTNLTAEEIHTLGLSEVKRIQAEIAKIQAQYGFVGSITEFLLWQAKQPETKPFTKEEEILKTYAELNNKIIPKLPELFGRTPKSLLEIHPEPELTRATMSDHYNSPAIDGSRPGIFYAVINDPTQYSNTSMTSLFLHEGQPGHHFHIALQQEMNLPNFRKFGWVTAYGEGWALYAETLGKELGLYQDPNQYLGHLKLELHRAVRLVTDTGLHAKGWTREETIKYMMDTQGVSEGAAINATERYMEWPGQALAYKIGALKIQELRKKAEQQLGDQYKLSAFHDFVLSEGVLPLSILEDKFGLWINQQKVQAKY